MKYARAVNGRVADVCIGDPAEKFHPLIASQFRPCGDNVQVGWFHWEGDNDFHETQEPYYVSIMTKFEFLSRLTMAERIAIRTAAKTDTIIEDFLSMMEIATDIDVKNETTIAGVDYLIEQKLLAPERRPEILAENLVVP